MVVAKFEIPGDCIHNSRSDGLLLVHKSADQRVFTDEIDDAGNSVRITVDGSKGIVVEYLLPIASCNSQSLLHVRSGLVSRKRVGLRTQGQALAQLPQVRLFQLLLQFRLADKHDLEQLFRKRLQVREHSYLLEYVVAEVLSF